MAQAHAWMPGRSFEDGGSAVEYGLLIAGIAGLVAAVVFLFGSTVSKLFDNTCHSIATGSSGRAAPVNC